MVSFTCNKNKWCSKPQILAYIIYFFQFLFGCLYLSFFPAACSVILVIYTIVSDSNYYPGQAIVKPIPIVAMIPLTLILWPKIYNNSIGAPSQDVVLTKLHGMS